jgi:hypothetical protein
MLATCSEVNNNVQAVNKLHEECTISRVSQIIKIIP